MSESLGRVLLVAGSRSLDDADPPRVWARTLLDRAIARLDPGRDWLLAGGARGPDTWAAEAARARGVRTLELKLDGLVWLDGRATHESWHDGTERPKDKRRYPLDRNDRLVERLASARAKGFEVACMALSAPWSETAGTEYTATRAEAIGVRACRNRYDGPVPTLAMPASAAAPGMDRREARAHGLLDVTWIDFEATGLDTQRCQIIEVGAVRCDASSKRVLDTFEAKIAVDPALVEEGARAVNGYSEARWRDARPASEVLSEFLRWLPRAFVLAGKNVASYDKPLLLRQLGELGLPSPGWRAKPIDPTRDIRRLLVNTGKIRDAKLDTACAYLGIPRAAYHSALDDAHAERRVYLALLGLDAPTAMATAE